MSRSRRLVVLLILSTVQCQGQADLDLLVKTLPGDYDNYMQWEGDVEKNVSASAAHSHVHSIYFPVQLAAFGRNVFYFQEYSDGVPTRVFRQRLYSFDSTMADGILLSFFDFKNPAKYVDAQKDPAKLDQLTREDTIALPTNCSVRIHRDGGRFIGQPASCHVEDPATGQPVRIQTSQEFGPDYVIQDERWFDATGRQIFGNPSADVLNRTRAARLFRG